MNTMIYPLAPSFQVIQLSGEFDAQGAAELRPILEQLLEQHQGDMVFSLQEVSFIDSSGIGALVFLYKRLLERQNRLWLVGVQGQVKDLLSMLRIDRVIPLHPDMESMRVQAQMDEAL